MKQISGTADRERPPSKAEIVTVKTCHNKASTCPHILIKTFDWKSAIDDWIRKEDLHEKVRGKIGARKVLYHHRLKISISSCPNSCSRPQIADIGLVAFVEPFVDAENCTVCGLCKDACIDRAISMGETSPIFDRVACLGCTKCRDSCPSDCIDISEPAVRILVGGKLGRHPHLAEEIGTAVTPIEMIHSINILMTEYLEGEEKGQRFADFWIERMNTNRRKAGIEKRRSGGSDHEETTA